MKEVKKRKRFQRTWHLNDSRSSDLPSIMAKEEKNQQRNGSKPWMIYLRLCSILRKGRLCLENFSWKVRLKHGRELSKKKRRQEGQSCTWGAILIEFRKKFIPAVIREKREEKFMNLKQRNLTVAEDEEKFTQLSKYAPEMVNTENKLKRHFQQGLTVKIQDALVTANVETYTTVVKMAQRIENSKAKEKIWQ